MSYIHDADDTDEALELRQAIIDLFSYIEHDRDLWLLPTIGGGMIYASRSLGEALDRAILLVIRQR